jgi:hypothetical protein
MKKLIAFLLATPIVWAILIRLIGMPFMKMVVSINLNGTPLFIHTDEQAMTVFRWMLGITGLMAAGFGAEIAAIVADWDRLIQRLFMSGSRRRY